MDVTKPGLEGVGTGVSPVQSSEARQPSAPMLGKCHHFPAAAGPVNFSLL